MTADPGPTSGSNHYGPHDVSHDSGPDVDGSVAPAAVEISGLSVRYRDVVAVDDLSMRVPEGTILALLGPNGAGKSSVLRSLCTVQQPAAGQIRLCGHDVRTDALAARCQLGVVFQEPTLDRDLSVLRNLRMHARLYGMGRAATHTRITQALNAFGLTERAKDPVERLSGGLARRLEIARAMLHLPRVLVLDEPTTGLDPQARRDLWADLHRIRQRDGTTIVFSTHYLDEAHHADQITILDTGRIRRAGTPAELRLALGESAVVVRTRDDAEARRRLAGAGFTVATDRDGLRVPCDEPEKEVAAVVAAVAVPVLEVSVRHPSLDDVYLATVGVQSEAEPEASATTVTGGAW